METAQLGIDVLGGVKLTNISELRVTLKITNLSNSYQLRHNLNLYHHIQVEKLIRTAAERLEIGSSVLRTNILTLTNELEKYRVDQLKIEDQPIHSSTQPLSEKERKEAVKFLSGKHLMKRTNDLIGQSGVIGEHTNRLLMYILFTSRKQANPLHCISFGSSGMGKTHLQSKVAELIPAEDKVEVTVLSANSFYYFDQRELQHKLILIEDMDGADGVLYPLRELQTKRRITKTVVHKDSKGRSRTIHIRVEGPVSVAGCTTREQVYEDNANRNFLLYIDESDTQDERIMDYQRSLSAGKINELDAEETRRFLQNVQRMLEPIKVINPYAELLKIPVSVFKRRRTNAHYLQFIEAVTFYHQHQRKRLIHEPSGKVYIESTLEDIEQANILMKDVLLQKSDAISRGCRTYFEQLKAYLQSKGETTFTNAEIRKTLRIAGTTLRRYHGQLLDGFYINRQGSKSKGYRYEIIDYEEYKALQTEVNSTLDNSLENIKRASEPNVSQS